MNTMKKKIYIIGALMFVVLVFGCGAHLMWGEKRAVTGGMEIQKDVVAWDGTLPVQKEIKQESIKVPFYGALTMRAGQKEIPVKLVNPKENNCYFVYEISLHDTGKEIYRSALLEPGKAIDGIQSNCALDRGDYELDIKILAYTLDTRQPMNNAVVSAELTVAE